MTMLMRHFIRTCLPPACNLTFQPSLTYTKVSLRTSTSLLANSSNSGTTPVVQQDAQGSSSEMRQDSDVLVNDSISKVNQQIQERSYGRLFAVVHLGGKQFKVTTEDLVVLEGYWPPSIGDKLRLNKVLLVGGTDFTLIGRPLLSPNLVYIEGTVIEKNMSHTRTHFRKKRRHQFQRINFYRAEQTTVRINTIELMSDVNKRRGIEESEDRVF